MSILINLLSDYLDAASLEYIPQVKSLLIDQGISMIAKIIKKTATESRIGLKLKDKAVEISIDPGKLKSKYDSKKKQSVISLLAALW